MRKLLFLVVVGISSFIFAQKEDFLSNTYRPLIFLDAGHGGLDQGAKIRYPYTEEKKLALISAHYVKKHLEQLGYRVSLTRSRDFFVPLPKRVDMANRFNCDLFVSLHFNSCRSKEVQGIEIYYFHAPNRRSTASKKLADNVIKRICAKTSARSRGIKKGNFYVIRETKMPSILIEGGFLTNKEERENLRKREYLDKYAKGIAEGIHQFVRSQGR